MSVLQLLVARTLHDLQRKASPGADGTEARRPGDARNHRAADATGSAREATHGEPPARRRAAG